MKQFSSAIKQIAEEKGISEQHVLETIEAALAAAYKRDYGKKGQIIKVSMNSETGDLIITQTYYVVEGMDEEGYITGPLPTKVSEDRQEELEALRASRRGEPQPVEEITTADGEIKIKFNPEKHMLLEDAKKKEKKIQVGDELVISLESHTEFGRIAAQTAKQVVFQRL